MHTRRRRLIPQTIVSLLLILPVLAAAGDRVPFDTIGGDDLVIETFDASNDVSLDIADDGTIFAALKVTDPLGGTSIQVFRSTDEGEIFWLWGELSDPDPAEGFSSPCLDVVEGMVDAVYVVYRRDRASYYASDICMVNSPLTGNGASWSAEAVVMSAPGIYHGRPRFDNDVTSHPNFYLYVVAEATDATGVDIWFTRSTDHGASFETPYMLATLGVDDRRYWYPDIAHGFGGYLHVVWYFSSDEGEFDSSIRYRRASNYADAGIADWGGWVPLTSHADGYDDSTPRVEAGAASDKVVVTYRRNVTGSTFVDTSLFVSHNAGASFDPAYHWTNGPYIVGDIEEEPGTGLWFVLGLDENDPSLYTANESNLTLWTGPETFQDADLPVYTVQRPDLALNPANGYRPAALWNYTGETSGDPNDLIFDADWRNDQGWPDMEPGFPVAIPPGEHTTPALVDLDLDQDLEIVFTDGDGLTLAYHHDGTPVDGWPVDMYVPQSAGPVAVGDLNGDGYPLVFVGTANGQAWAYDHTGFLMPGWPVTVGDSGEDVFVSIGALGGIHHRTVVCVAGNKVRYFTRRGETPDGAVNWTFGGDADFVAPAAIGDIDLDGVAEVVGARHTAVFAAEMLSGSLDFVVSVGHPANDAPTLADLDLDGDLEIFVPSQDGYLTVLEHTGAFVDDDDFPWYDGYGFGLSSAALADFRITGEPEIAFATDNSLLNVLYHTGVMASGFPTFTSSAVQARYMSPIVENLELTATELVIAARWGIHAYKNTGDEVHGWPRWTTGEMRGSPAAADIDRDSHLEIVVVTDDELHVYTSNSSRGFPGHVWPMYAFDPERSGCQECPEVDMTSVDPDPDGERITRVSFAAPSPNPVSGSARFSYAVPTRAVVSLEVYDVRGACVATVLREEFGPGRKVLSWNGRDDTGAPLASGHYFARLRVRGPGVNEELVRKLTVLR